MPQQQSTHKPTAESHQKLHQPTLRVIKILELLANTKDALTLSLISKTLSIPTGTLSPILQTLSEQGYILCHNKGYCLSDKISELGLGVKAQSSIIELLRKYMRAIRDQSEQTCQMGILKGGDVLYLEKFDSPNEIQLKSFIGASYPAYATSLGKALLSKKSKQELRKIYPKPFIQITPKTLRDIDSLYAQLQHIQKEQIALESGEMSPQIECMAIPIEHKNAIIAAISISYLVFYSNDEFKARNKQILLAQKERIERELQYSFYDEVGI